MFEKREPWTSASGASEFSRETQLNRGWSPVLSLRNSEWSNSKILKGERGEYRILGLVAYAGMCRLYRAQQLMPVQRVVTIKTTMSELGRHEQLIVSRLQHGNIVQVYDLGISTGSDPSFIVYEHVDGESLTDYCDDRALGLEARMAIFLQVCGVVEYVHQMGIVHRNLKPRHLLVTGEQGQATVKLKGLDLALLREEMENRTKEIVGTRAYMSPEQARGDLSVDARSDVYSLGVVLYELLVGVHPRLLSDDALDVYILRSEPQLPSRQATEVEEATASKRGLSARQLSRRLRGDLDAVLLKAVNNDAKSRYQGASELRLDLEAFLKCEPVTASLPTLRNRICRLLRRLRKRLLGS